MNGLHSITTPTQFDEETLLVAFAWQYAYPGRHQPVYFSRSANKITKFRNSNLGETQTWSWRDCAVWAKQGRKLLNGTSIFDIPENRLAKIEIID